MAGMKTILVSPERHLGRLPLGALPGAKPGTYLVEDYAFALMPFPQLLGEIWSAPPGVTNRGPAFLGMGDVDYGAPTTQPGVAEQFALLNRRGGSTSAWTPCRKPGARSTPSEPAPPEYSGGSSADPA